MSCTRLTGDLQGERAEPAPAVRIDPDEILRQAV
jgi:hypothetical protein